MLQEKEKKKNPNINLKEFDDFLVKHGNEIPIIPEHLLHRTNPKEEVIIISYEDDKRFIVLSGMYAKTWNLINGKSPWEKIFNSLSHDNPFLIYEKISAILKNKDFSIISSISSDKKKYVVRKSKSKPGTSNLGHVWIMQLYDTVYANHSTSPQDSSSDPQSQNATTSWGGDGFGVGVDGDVHNHPYSYSAGGYD